MNESFANVFSDHVILYNKENVNGENGYNLIVH